MSMQPPPPRPSEPSPEDPDRARDGRTEPDEPAIADETGTSPVEFGKPTEPTPPQPFPAAWPAPTDARPTGAPIPPPYPGPYPGGPHLGAGPNSAGPYPGTGPYPAGPYPAGPYPGTGPYTAGPYPGGPNPGAGPNPGWPQANPWGPPAGGSVWAPPPFGQSPSGTTNGQAIAAFVLGLLAIVPVSVVFGIVALVRIGRTRQRGKGLAIAGLVLSGLWVVVGAGGVLLGAHYAVTHSNSATPFNPPRGAEPEAELPIGTCFNQPTDEDGDLIPVVPCDQLHDFQLYAKLRLPDSFTGDAADVQQATVACGKALGASFPDPVALQGTAVPSSYYPVGDYSHQWCALTAWNGDNQLASNLLLATSYTPAQQEYLRATDRTALLRTDVSLTDDSQWRIALPLAAQLAQADRTEAQTLTADHWSDSFVAGTAAGIAKDDLAEAQELSTLSHATSENQWTHVVNSIWQYEANTTIDTMRANLGLPKTG